jgi:thymidylate kinase
MVAQAANNVFTFTITGGPCAGKTTALAHLLKTQPMAPFEVMVVPEAATLYHQYGAKLPYGVPASTCGRVSESDRNLIWEVILCELKRTLETRTINAALKSGKPSVVLCDRGIFDSRAYLPTDREWNAMLELAGWDEGALASRYDHVFHLGMCPADVYSRASNEARREDYEEASNLDRLTWAAWEGTHSEPEAHTRVGSPTDRRLEAKLDSLTKQMQLQVERRNAPLVAEGKSDRSRSQYGAERGTGGLSTAHRKRLGWYLPPEAIIALADKVAAAPDLSQIAPTALSVVRRVGRIDRGLPSRIGRVAWATSRDSAWLSALAAEGSSRLRRDPRGREHPDSPLAF